METQKVARRKVCPSSSRFAPQLHLNRTFIQVRGPWPALGNTRPSWDWKGPAERLLDEVGCSSSYGGASLNKATSDPSVARRLWAYMHQRRRRGLPCDMTTRQHDHTSTCSTIHSAADSGVLVQQSHFSPVAFSGLAIT